MTCVIVDGDEEYKAEIFDEFDLGIFTIGPYDLAVRADGSLVILRKYLYELRSGVTHFESAHNDFTLDEVIA